MRRFRQRGRQQRSDDPDDQDDVDFESGLAGSDNFSMEEVRPEAVSRRHRAYHSASSYPPRRGDEPGSGGVSVRVSDTSASTRRRGAQTAASLPTEGETPAGLQGLLRAPATAGSGVAARVGQHPGGCRRDRAAANAHRAVRDPVGRHRGLGAGILLRSAGVAAGVGAAKFPDGARPADPGGAGAGVPHRGEPEHWRGDRAESRGVGAVCLAAEHRVHRSGGAEFASAGAPQPRIPAPLAAANLCCRANDSTFGSVVESLELLSQLLENSDTRVRESGLLAYSRLALSYRSNALAEPKLRQVATAGDAIARIAALLSTGPAAVDTRHKAMALRTLACFAEACPSLRTRMLQNADGDADGIDMPRVLQRLSSQRGEPQQQQQSRSSRNPDRLSPAASDRARPHR
eukprot:ctg_3427.g479